MEHSDFSDGGLRDALSVQDHRVFDCYANARADHVCLEHLTIPAGANRTHILVLHGPSCRSRSRTDSQLLSQSGFGSARAPWVHALLNRLSWICTAEFEILARWGSGRPRAPRPKKLLEEPTTHRSPGLGWLRASGSRTWARMLELGALPGLCPPDGLDQVGWARFAFLLVLCGLTWGPLCSLRAACFGPAPLVVFRRSL